MKKKKTENGMCTDLNIDRKRIDSKCGINSFCCNSGKLKGVKKSEV